VKDIINSFVELSEKIFLDFSSRFSRFSRIADDQIGQNLQQEKSAMFEFLKGLLFRNLTKFSKSQQLRLCETSGFMVETSTEVPYKVWTSIDRTGMVMSLADGMSDDAKAVGTNYCVVAQ
jgi:hypothetical protein